MAWFIFYSEFENLKVHINILPLITDRKLVTNKIEMIDGVIDLPNVFKKPLNVNNILLEGNLNPNDKEIYLENFSSSINKDFYQGSAKLDLKNFEVSGNPQCKYCCYKWGVVGSC